MTLSTHKGQVPRHLLIATLGATILLSGCQTGRRQPRLPDPGTRPVRPVVPVVVRQRNLVAIIVPTSGRDGAIGQSIANAAHLALADSGEQSLRLTVYDSAAPGGASRAAQRALADGNRLSSDLYWRATSAPRPRPRARPGCR